MKKVKAVPKEVTAIQWDGSKKALRDIFYYGNCDVGKGEAGTLKIQSEYGVNVVYPDEWVVIGCTGNVSVVSNLVFNHLYESIE